MRSKASPWRECGTIRDVLDPFKVRDAVERWLVARERRLFGLPQLGAFPRLLADEWMDAPLEAKERSALAAHIARAAREDALTAARAEEARWWAGSQTIERDTRARGEWATRLLVPGPGQHIIARALDSAVSGTPPRLEAAFRAAAKAWERFDVEAHPDVPFELLPPHEVLAQSDELTTALAERFDVRSAWQWPAALTGADLRARHGAVQRHRRVAEAFASLPLARSLERGVRVHKSAVRARVYVLGDHIALRMGASEGILGDVDAAFAIGRAMALAWIDASQSPVFRFPVAASFPRALGCALALAQGMVLKKGRLSAERRETERCVMAAITLQLRVAAAACLSEGLARDRATRAFGADSGHLEAFALRAPSARLRLRGALGGLALHWVMREHFDEDWYRNPAASEPLVVAARAGGAQSCDALLHELGSSLADGMRFLCERVSAVLD